MKSSNDRMLRLIAIFEFFKAALLIALGVGLFRMFHKDIGSVIEHWCEALRLDPGSHCLNRVLESDQCEPGANEETWPGKFPLRRIISIR